MHDRMAVQDRQEGEENVLNSAHNTSKMEDVYIYTSTVTNVQGGNAASALNRLSIDANMQ